MKPGEDVIVKEKPDPGAKHPFGKRFHAWWNGYALAPSQAGESASPSGGRDAGPDIAASEADEAEPAPDASGPKPEVSDSPTPEGAAKPKPDAIRKSDIWPADRIEIAERVWGEGFVLPGGLNHVLNLTRPLGIDASGGVLEMGPGTGGFGRLITENFGAPVASWIPDPALTDMAAIHTRNHGCDNRVSTLELVPREFEAKPEHFSVGLIHECLYLVEDKEALLRNLIKSMRPCGEFLIYDFFCEVDDARLPLVEWMEAEPGEVYPMGIDTATELIGRLGVDLTATEEESTSYAAAVLKEWGNFVDSAERSALRPELAMSLVQEVEYWTRLVGAIDCGALKVFRINGKRKAELSW